MNDKTQQFRNLTLSAFCAGLVVFGYMIVSPAFHIDAELAKVFGFDATNVALGRWGTALVHKTLLPEPFVPFFTPLFSIALVALAAATAALCFELSGEQGYLFTLLFMAFPQFAYQMEFLFQADCIAFGLLLATCSFAALTRAEASGRYLFWAAASVTFLVLSGAFYQSLLFVPLALVMVRSLNRLQTLRVSFQRHLLDVAVVVALTIASVLIYEFLTKMVQHLAGIPRAPWLDSMIGWTHGTWRDCIVQSLGGMERKILGGDFYGNGIYASTLLAAAVIMVRSYSKNFLLKDVVKSAIASATSLAMPFVLNIPFGSDMPARTFLAAPIGFAGMWAIALQPTARRLGFLPAIAVAIALAYGSYHVSGLATADAMAFEADKLLGNRIVAEIYRADPAFHSEATPVYFLHGFAPLNVWRQPQSDPFGASFFAWDGGNPDRIIGFLRAVGIADLHRATDAQLTLVAKDAVALPAWPNPGSVRLIHDILVVKLGND